MSDFETTGAVDVGEDLLKNAKEVFLSYASTEENIISVMADVYEKEDYPLCPHTATAAFAVRELRLPAERTVCLATASPHKFEEAVSKAVEKCNKEFPPLPHNLQELNNMPARTQHLDNSLSQVKEYILKTRSEKIKRPWYKNGLVISSLVAITASAVALIILARRR